MADPSSNPNTWRLCATTAIVVTGGLWRQLVRTQRARELAERRLGTLIATTDEATVVTDRHGQIRWASPGTGRVLGAVDLHQDTLMDYLLPSDRPRLTAGLAQLVESERDERVTVRGRLRASGGSWIEVDLVITDRSQDPAVEGMVIMIRRPADTSEDALRWRHQALHDELTDLANRGGLFESLELLSAPSPGGRRCGVIYADLDGFKAINDTYGHAAGDQLLVLAADRLRALVRPGDTVARLGGDEFVIVVDDVRDVTEASDIAERARRSLAEPMAIGALTVRITASFGIALGHDHTASSLLNLADVAAYEAKRGGGDRCCVWSPALGSDDQARLEGWCQR